MGFNKTADAAEFIKTDYKWPYWPVLPLKRGKECGTIICEDKTTILFVNVWDLHETDLDTVRKQKYETVEELLNDGWEVD